MVGKTIIGDNTLLSVANWGSLGVAALDGRGPHWVLLLGHIIRSLLYEGMERTTTRRRVEVVLLLNPRAGEIQGLEKQEETGGEEFHFVFTQRRSR